MKKILFLTGTRADFGKMKPLMNAVEDSNQFECYIFVTGMHTLKEFGNTQVEVLNDGYTNVQIYMNQVIEEPMDLVLANTINGFGRYIREMVPDLIIIHGDRIEALAAAVCGAINNILVAHVEGGEVSGTIDESIRHSISKLSHIHFVSNERAKSRLQQLGEYTRSIYVIGSPDIDAILNSSSIDFDSVLKHYAISFRDYAILMFHPVTTEIDTIRDATRQLVDSVLESGDNYIVIHPNNDHGYKLILDEYKRFSGKPNFRVFPSVRFEYFIELLKHANYIIGNSSAGIHEAPVVGIPVINIGTRQNHRFQHQGIINCDYSKKSITDSILQAKSMAPVASIDFFGTGDSRTCFERIIHSLDFWKTSHQKSFTDIPFRAE